jgi:hypothetical protein
MSSATFLLVILFAGGCVSQSTRSLAFLGRSDRPEALWLNPPGAGARAECQEESVSVPGNWARVDALQSGIPIIVTLRSELQMRGDFQTSDTDGISLLNSDGDEIRAVKADVQEVRCEREDGNWNGILIGVGAGVGGALLLMEQAQKGTSTDLLGTRWAAAPFVLGGLGALIGWMVDDGHKGTDVVYRAP